MPMASDSVLFDTFDLKGLILPNRFVMPAMTRGRIPEDGVPDDRTVRYYAQRASAGLIIAEGTLPMAGAVGFPNIPAIYTRAQIDGWRRVVDAVRERGGRMYLQLWHAGRISNAGWQPDGRPPVGPSAIRATGALHMTREGVMAEPDTPRALTTAEIGEIVEGFADAAHNAIEAGFEGVEIHGANGYLVHQFFSDHANQRGDAYGGPAMNRARFAIEMAEAIAGRIGAHRTGIRISPLAAYQNAPVTDPGDLYSCLLRELSRIGLAYVHCIEGEPAGINTPWTSVETSFDFRAARRLFDGAWIANNGFDAQRAAMALEAGEADLISFGRPFIANPDFVERVRAGAPIADVVRSTVYAGDGETGYTDYPTMGDTGRDGQPAW